MISEKICLRKNSIYGKNGFTVGNIEKEFLNDKDIKTPLLKTYQSCREYQCPYPELLQFITFQSIEECTYWIQADPDGDIRYEITLSNKSMLHGTKE